MLRATFKSLLAHKLRLLLSAVAVVLGVAFVAGSFVFTDTIRKTFDDLFTQVSADVTVQPKPAVDGGAFDASTGTLTLPASLLDTVRRVDGVAYAHGDVTAEGVNIIGTDGKPIGSPGAPGIGVDWTDASTSPLRLAEGQPPRSAEEVAIDSVAMKKGAFRIGDRIKLIMPSGPPRTVTLVGVFKFGTSGNLAGATLTAFEPATAQRLLLGPAKYSTISLDAAEGVSHEELKQRVTAVLPTGFEAKTKDEMAEQASKDISQALGFISTILLGFAGVALFVGSFIILNTFSMIVAQRTRELALLRAVGASRAQVRRSMVVEALVVGGFGSVVGILAGIGIAKALQALFKAVGLEISTGALVVTPRTIIVSLVVGIVVTVLAAYVPARRAAKVPPIAAMRDITAVEHSMRVRGIVGSALAALGVLGLVGALTIDDGSSAAMLLGIGVLLVLLGAIALAPLLGRPIVKVLGAPFRRLFGTVGRLSTDNAERNPRRTAATASALMIGLALVGAFGVLAASISASVGDIVDRQLGSDYVVLNSTQTPFSADVARRISETEGVGSVVRQRYGASAKVGDATSYVVATDADGLAHAVRINMVAGQPGALTDGTLLVSKETADERKLTVGQTLSVTLIGGSRQLKVGAIFERNQFLAPYVLTIPTWEALGGDKRDMFLYVNVRDGADVAATGKAIERVLADYPTVQLQDQTAFKEEQKSGVNQLLYLIYGLLALAIVIAVLGIINTLALSVIERTREIGLLRAVGLSRGQLRRMVTLESVVIALLGAVLGLTLGVGFGAVMQRVLSGEGIERLAIPAGQLVVFLVLAALIGVLAALWPARRAARLDVLRAITTE